MERSYISTDHFISVPNVIVAIGTPLVTLLLFVPF